MRVLFPLGLRVGTDIIATSRILSLHRPDYYRLAKLTNRFLLPQELEDLTGRFPAWRDAHAHGQLRTQQLATWIAGRWAAKEAAKKAWDASLLGFRDLRVEAEKSGVIQIVCGIVETPPNISDSTFPKKVTEQVAQLSISHDGDYTIATVLATPLHPDISTELHRRRQEAYTKVRKSAP